VQETRSAPSTVRNRAVILDVLQDQLPTDAEVLEIGSGTGEHAVHFAKVLTGVTWHTSDLVEHHSTINRWITERPADNVMAPVELDVRDSSHWQRAVDVVYTANTAHIMGADAVIDMLALAGRILVPAGLLIVYGPFRVGNKFTTASNERFDSGLRASNPEMGIRDLEWMDGLAEGNGLDRTVWMAMPSNNFIVVWAKRAN